MKSKLLLLILISSLSSTAQVIIQSHVKMPLDSLEKGLFHNSLNEFLFAADKGDKENKTILKDEKLATLLLLDEIKGITDANTFKPYLLSMLELDSQSYLIQLVYSQIRNDESYQKAQLTLIAHKEADSFKFSTPLRRNTTYWKSKIMQNTTFYYLGNLNLENVTSFVEKTTEIDTKLKLPEKSTSIYLTENLSDVFNLIGINYLAPYNGRRFASTMASLNNSAIAIHGNGNPGFETFDTHDLWHERLGLAVNRRKTNRPVDEGCAYLYGGSWGYTWEEILTKFITTYADRKDIDWKYYKEHQENFGENQEKHLMVDYVANALIIEKLEKEIGFSAVLEFLNSGPYEKGNANYYKTLEKLTGVSEEDYSDMVWDLINSSKE
ncbi:hypothetical protein [uncultured Arcticibacterium sp.]|uniref:hypothetical protein n=1 Tax=uncultured Arcticibacterium sp. TaxID=2173042 RepID=UPI0030F770EF